MAEDPLTDAELARVRAILADDDGSGGYPSVEGITWRATYSQAEVKQRSLWWTVGGGVVSAFFLVFAGLVLYRMTGAPAVVGITGAVVGGLVLVCAGIGQLHGEVLHAQDVEPQRVRPAVLESTGVADVVRALKEGVGGLTAARSMVFAGAALLAIAALGAGLSALGGDGDDPVPSPSPSVSPTL